MSFDTLEADHQQIISETFQTSNHLVTVVLAVLVHLEDVGGSAGAGGGQGQGQTAAHGHHRLGEPQV